MIKTFVNYSMFHSRNIPPSLNDSCEGYYLNPYNIMFSSSIVGTMLKHYREEGKRFSCTYTFQKRT